MKTKTGDPIPVLKSPHFTHICFQPINIRTEGLPVRIPLGFTNHAPLPIPKGLRPPAQGWRACEPTLGERATNLSTATRLWPGSHVAGKANGRNRVAVDHGWVTMTQPRRRSGQPWALGHNPFGIAKTLARLPTTSDLCPPTSAPFPARGLVVSGLVVFFLRRDGGNQINLIRHPLVVGTYGSIIVRIMRKTIIFISPGGIGDHVIIKVQGHLLRHRSRVGAG
jgi:hypothetical protein